MTGGTGRRSELDGELYPACPSWCARPDDHDVPTEPRTGDVLHRRHLTPLAVVDGAGEVRVGEVRLEQLDEVIVRGPVVPGTPEVVVQLGKGIASTDDIRALSAELARVLQGVFGPGDEGALR